MRFRKSKLLNLIFLSGLVMGAVFSAWVVPAAHSSNTVEMLNQLRRGEVVVRTVPNATAPPDQVQAQVLIEAPAERVWTIMNECDRAPRFIPGLMACRILENKPEGQVIEHRVRYSWLLPEVTYTFLAEYDRFKRIRFQRLSGDLKAFRGSWKLEPLDEGATTLVSYSVYIDPGFFIPQAIIRFLLRRDLPELMIALRDEVQAP